MSDAGVASGGMTAGSRMSAGQALGLQCTGVCMRYGKTRALDGLNLALEPGAAVGLVGRNGAGKSTLFRCIIGGERPDAGTMSSQPMMTRVEFLARTGFVPDALSAYDWMTVGSAIDYVAALQPRFDAAWSRELVEILALDRTKKVKALSRGMQARLAFVLGLSHRPDLVLLDEPLLGVDAVSHDAVLEVLARMRSDTGCTLLIASHQLTDLARLTERVAFIENGRIVEEVVTEDLISRTKRVIIKPAPAESWVPPARVILSARRDGALVLTVHEFDERVGEALRQSAVSAAPDSRVEIIDLSIIEACADRLRAMEVRA